MHEEPIEMADGDVPEVPDDFVRGPEQDALVELAERVDVALARFDDQKLCTTPDWVGQRLLVDWIGPVPLSARAAVELVRGDGPRVEFVRADPSRGPDRTETSIRLAMAQLDAAGFDVPSARMSKDGDAIELVIATVPADETRRAEDLARALERQTGYLVRLQWTDDPPRLTALAATTDE